MDNNNNLIERLKYPLLILGGLLACATLILVLVLIRNMRSQAAHPVKTPVSAAVKATATRSASGAQTDIPFPIETPSVTATKVSTPTPAVIVLTTTPTKTFTPSPTAGLPTPTQVKVVKFQSGSANTVPPDDILKEIYYVGGGGGGGGFPCSSKQPAVEPLEDAYEQESSVILRICNWGTDTNHLLITIERPDGMQYAVGEFLSSGSGTFTLYITLDDPVGWYRIQASSYDKVASNTFFVYPSRGTRLIARDVHHLLMTGFQPLESVRLFALDTTFDKDHPNGISKIKAWQAYQVDPAGTLHIETDLTTNGYAAVGDQSGEASLSSAFLLFGGVPHSGLVPSDCPGVRPSLLKPNETARLKYLFSYEYLMHDFATYDASSPKLKPGTRLKLLNGPVCAYERFEREWMVETEDGQEGWISDYFIEKMPAPLTGCENALPTRLERDKVVDVLLPTLVYQDLSADSLVTAQVQPGGLLAVLDGPRCESGNLWWQVQLEDNRIGWTPEMQDGNYVLQPRITTIQ